MQGMHVPTEQAQAVEAALAEDGLRAVVAPARSSLKSKQGTRGGTMVGLRRDLQDSSFRHLANAESHSGATASIGNKNSRSGLDTDDWTPIAWHLNNVTLLVVSVYFDVGDKLGGRNAEKMTAVFAFLMMTDEPLVSIGYLHMWQDVMLNNALCQRLGGKKETSPRPTSRPPVSGARSSRAASHKRASLIDYAVVEPRARHICVEAVLG